VWVFTAAAVFQLGWGALALRRDGPVIASIGILGNGALVAGWLLAKRSGISFVDGLEDAEPVQLADGLAAGLAIFAAVAATASSRLRSIAAPFVTLLGTVAVGVAVLGMNAAGTHAHADGHGAADGHAHSGDAEAAAGSVAAVVPPKEYDPTKPIDLSGVDGVTPDQQARAENLIAATLLRLPQFSDQAAAEAVGFHSIRDEGTGYEHLVNWSYINDDKLLDPTHPESLVYRVEGGQKRLVSAMFMLPEGSTLEGVPDIGGPLTQWHIHDDLCFTDDPLAPIVAGVTSVGGSCPSPLTKFTPVPMIHVWIVKHPCGPFAALEGVGAGQIKPGETRLCDHVHGGA
jgi:hypothetical protein